MMRSTEASLPAAFCWTRYGTEAGETIDAILRRKEGERLANGGLFLWGIGNSVGAALECLAQETDVPEVLFSPIRTKPRAIDVGPSRVVAWMTAEHPDGSRHALPRTMMVKGRATVGGKLAAHYALVCRSTDRLIPVEGGEVHLPSLVNLGSGRPVGASQVTAVVRRSADDGSGPVYPITLRAQLVFPYCIRLRDPVDVSSGDDLAEALPLDGLIGAA